MICARFFIFSGIIFAVYAGGLKLAYQEIEENITQSILVICYDIKEYFITRRKGPITGPLGSSTLALAIFPLFH